MKTTEQRVAAGVAFLDKHYGPKWPEAIDLEGFDIVDPCGCVLGQLEGGYYTACQRLGLTQADQHESLQMDAAHALGFYENAIDTEDCGDPHRYERWMDLEREWAAVIGNYQLAVSA